MAKNKQSLKKIKEVEEVKNVDKPGYIWPHVKKVRDAEDPELFDAKCQVCSAEFEEVDLRKNGCPACGHAGLVKK